MIRSASILLFIVSASSAASPARGPSAGAAAVNADSNAVEVAGAPDRPFVPKPTRTLATLRGFSPQPPPPLTRYGGRADRQGRATGYFHVERLASRFWLVDPDGGLFLSVGLCTIAGDPPGGRQAVAERFGSVEKWAAQTADLLRDCRFNTLGCWSWWEDFRKLPRPFPYTTQWRFLTTFEDKLGGRPFERRPRTSPRSLVCLFDPGFEAFCDQHARQLASTKDDPWLLGHFTDNELPFQVKLLDEFLKLPPDHTAHKAAQQWLDSRPDGTKRPFGDETQEAFRQFVVERYFRIVSAAVRKYDPNHLYIGTRFHGRAFRSETVLRTAAPYLDVVSINYYGAWTPEPDQMRKWVDWTGKPFLVTEWYAKGMDSGLANKAGAGWTVHTQEDRARFYQNYALGLLADPGCVGWHWFRYQDNGPQREGGTSNKGLVNLEFRPYAVLRASMRELNAQVYTLADYFHQRRQDVK